MTDPPSNSRLAHTASSALVLLALTFQASPRVFASEIPLHRSPSINQLRALVDEKMAYERQVLTKLVGTVKRYGGYETINGVQRTMYRLGNREQQATLANTLLAMGEGYTNFLMRRVAFWSDRFPEMAEAIKVPRWERWEKLLSKDYQSQRERLERDFIPLERLHEFVLASNSEVAEQLVENLMKNLVSDSKAHGLLVDSELVTGETGTFTRAVTRISFTHLHYRLPKVEATIVLADILPDKEAKLLRPVQLRPTSFHLLDTRTRKRRWGRLGLDPLTEEAVERYRALYPKQAPGLFTHW